MDKQHKMDRIYKLVKLRDAMIPVLFIAEDYGLKTQQKMISDIFPNIFAEMKELGVSDPPAINVGHTDNQLYCCSDGKMVLFTIEK